MSQELINRSPDLKKLRDTGYEVEVRGTKLLVNSVPYLDANGNVCYGTLVTVLELAGDKTKRPEDHKMYFIGTQPCRKNKTEIESIKLGVGNEDLGDGIVVNRSFSNKPAGGYADYFEKVTRYIEIISAPARSLSPDVTAKTFKLIESAETESIFRYLDTNSSRAEIDRIVAKLRPQKVAIIGVGGTGSYVLDFVAKTPASEIHIFDGDEFLQHNAFRTPGAASVEELRERPSKVEYLASVYSKMRRNIVVHLEYIDPGNIPSFEQFSIVFICTDRGSVKKPLIESLELAGVPYIDVGMGIQVIDDSLIGILRVTTGTAEFKTTIAERGRISFDENNEDHLYDTNIQIAELNALNAALAVIKWKKLVGFYSDITQEHNTLYTINDNLLHNDDSKA
jgi:hypothetical protein